MNFIDLKMFFFILFIVYFSKQFFFLDNKNLSCSMCLIKIYTVV